MSKGFIASPGESFRALITRFRQNTAHSSGRNGASEPPATITSTSSSTIIRIAWPMASLPDALPAQYDAANPRRPSSSAISPAPAPV
jgi:hypothetical protein